MRLFAYACAAACVVAGSSAFTATVEAQEGEPIPAASNAAETQPTQLPAVVVETQQAPKTKAKPNKKKSSIASAAPMQQQAAPPPTGPGNSSTSDKTAYGPVRNYSANSTATGMKTDTPLKEIPQSISVVGAEQIRDTGSQNMQEALRYVPGVVADAYGIDSRSDGSFIRGTDATEYLDGLRRTFSYYTYNYRIDPFFMERVEVLRGPASVLYGQAEVGGIINAVSKRPQTEQGGEITVEYGTFDFKQVKFDMTGPVTSDGKWSYRLTGLARDADTQVDYVEDDRYAIAPAITYRPDGNTTITVLGHFQKDRTGSTSQFLPHVGTLYPNANGRFISQNRFAGEPGDYYDTDVASGTLLVEHKFNSALKLQHSSRYADIHNDYDSTYASWYYLDPAEETLTRTRYIAITDTQIFNQDTNLEAKFTTGALSHKIIGGIDYANFQAQTSSGWAANARPFNVYNPVYGQNPDYNSYFPCGTANYVSVPSVPMCSYTDQEITQTGLYIQDQMRLGNWIAVAGARKDWVENEIKGGARQKDDAVSYRAGLMYEFASGLTPYISYSESFVPIADVDKSGNPFQPKQGRMYEAGFKYQPTGANFAINAAVYDIAESNRLSPDSSDPTHNIQIGGVSVQGVEIEVVGQMTKNLKVAGGYSYTNAQYDDGTTVFDAAYSVADVSGNQIESIPKHLASMWGVWEFDEPYLKGWSVGAGVRYIGASWDSTNTIEVPNVTLFDAMIAYEEDNWRWSINGRNLGDKEYISTCLQRGDCWLGTARTITTGLTYKY